MSTSWPSDSLSRSASPRLAMFASRFGGKPLLTLPALTNSLLGIGGLIMLLLLWWLGTDVLASSEGFIRQFSPTTAIPKLVTMLAQADLSVHIFASLCRVLIGLAFALLIGVPVGLAVGSYSRLNTATSPAFQFLRMISPLSWMPIAVMMFGVGDQPIYFMLAFAAVWPILLSTAEGVRRLQPSWLSLVDSLAATRWETLWYVILPGVLGHVLTGLRLSVGIVWLVLVPCELLGVSAGLGYFILDTRDRLAYSELMATVLMIGILGFLLDVGARMLYQTVTRSRTA